MWKKIAGYGVLGLVCLAGTGSAYMYFRQPEMRPAANVHVRMTPERIARGKYIFTLADCDGCHSQHDETKVYRPVVESGRGRGQKLEMDGMPGSVVAPNITPDIETGIGSWSDGEKLRAIREGIDREGKALFPMMPYTNYRHMSDEDAESLVAYLNTLQPIRNQLPGTKLDFPVNLIIKGSPSPVSEPIPTPDQSNVVRYGEYLATMGSCQECHTPFSKGSEDSSKRLAGGRLFSGLGYSVVSSNITPDNDTGIGNWTEAYFRERFTRHRTMKAEDLPAITKETFTLMPWRHLAQLPDSDLNALYAYLRSRPAISNRVTAHPAAK